MSVIRPSFPSVAGVVYPQNSLFFFRNQAIKTWNLFFLIILNNSCYWMLSYSPVSQLRDMTPKELQTHYPKSCYPSMMITILWKPCFSIFQCDNVTHAWFYRFSLQRSGLMIKGEWYVLKQSVVWWETVLFLQWRVLILWWCLFSIYVSFVFCFGSSSL